MIYIFFVNLQITGIALFLLTSPWDWQYKTETNSQSCLASKDRQCRISAGYVLGGSNSIGHLTYIRGNPREYNNWNITGWSWNDLYPYFLKYEGMKTLDELPESSIPYHNTEGFFKMDSFADPENVWHERIQEGFNELNVPINPDVNAKSQIGITSRFGYIYKGERMSVARAYLTREETKKTLHVALHTTATEIIIDDQLVARGVILKTNCGLFSQTLRVYAKKEVIISAGYIGTPKLLLLSGVGPADELNALGIQAKVDLPVGKNFFDHSLPLVAIQVDKGFGIDLPNPLPVIPYITSLTRWFLTKDGPMASNGLDDVFTLLNTDCYDFINHKLTNTEEHCEIPDFQYIHVYLDRNMIALAKPFIQNSYGLNDAAFAQLSKANVNNAFIMTSPTLLHSESHGIVTLRSTNPSDPPIIKPNYLSKKVDLNKMVKALKILEDLVNSSIFKYHGASILYLEFDDCPKPKANGPQSDAYWECYARQMTVSGLHGTGTAAIRKVVDERLRVKNIRQLRVVDSSVMPRPPNGNSGAAVFALSEKAADLILEDNKENTL